MSRGYSNKSHFARCQAAFPEANIQGLKEAAQLHTREAAINALRHTRGDTQQAFLNDLDALALNQDLVDALVREYASFRCGRSACMLPSDFAYSSRRSLLKSLIPLEVGHDHRVTSSKYVFSLL